MTDREREEKEKKTGWTEKKRKGRKEGQTEVEEKGEERKRIDTHRRDIYIRIK